MEQSQRPYLPQAVACVSAVQGRAPPDNVVAVLLFVVNWYTRGRAGAPPNTSAYVFSLLLGVGLALWTGWLGSELVDRLGLGEVIEPTSNASQIAHAIAGMVHE